ncbi:myosin light chain kinase, smooth muscle-like [Antedon mediterranea]|uniref:myosin light chain kinase, smooth muscle-like n=1 Tax=Antedon mediterranea TaxID=105859 RepID=UPI003AF5E9D2
MSVRKTVELSPGRTKGIGALAAKFETKNKIETSTTTKSIKAEPSFASRFQKVNDNITTNGKAKDVGNFNHSPVKKPTKPPAFGLKPKRESCRAGGKASFHCTAFGMSKPDVTWSFNGTALENSKRHKIHIDKGIYYLEIIDLVLEDAGTYICKMENAAGSVESPVELTVRDNQKRFQNGLTPTSSPVPNLNSKSPSVSSSTKLNAFQKFNDLCKTNGSPSSNRVNKSPIEVSTKREKTSTTIKLSSTVKQNDEPKKLQTKTLKFELKKGQQSVKPKSDDIVDSPVTPKTITKTNVTKDEASPKQTSLMPSSTDTTESTSIKRTSLLTPTKFSTDSDVASPKRTSYSNPTSTTKVPVVVEWTPPAMTNKSSEVGESNSPNQTSITTTSKVKAVAEPTSPKRTVSSTSKTTVTLSTGVEQTSPKRTLPTTDSNVPMSVEATTPTRTLIPKTQKVTLKVQQPPQFTSRPKSQTTKESKLAKFTCTITGDPIPEVKWMKDGQAIPEETRIQILENETEHSIEISDVIQSDAGRYSCVLSNPAGKTTASCQLSVQANPTTLPKVEHQFPPTFLRKLSDLKCKDAESVSFECRVSGTPKPNVSWFFEGKPITHDNVYQISFDEPVAKLTIAEVFPEDGGNYTCTLAYPAGTISSTARLEVEEANDINGSETNGPMSNSIDLAIIPEKTSTPVKSTSAKIVTKPLSPIVMTTAPEFLKKLTDVTVDDGSSLTLKVEVKGSPAPTALWFFKDEEIIEEEDFKFVSDGNTLSLVIAEVYPEDAGMYTCVITNSEGKASTSCKVLVDESGDVGIPPSFMQKPHQMNIDEGTIITLTCKVDGDPEPNVFWYKESRIIKPSDRVQLVSKGFSHSLRIPAAIVTDTGSYTCIAKNEVGEEKCTVSVMVHQIEEEHTDFRSLLKSRPKLQKMDNINQNEEENEAGQLDFRHVLNKSKSEEEELQAATDAAIKESEAEQLDFRHLLTRHVQTKQHPKFTNELSDAMVDEGSSAVLVCSVVGTPVPTIIWKFKGKEIKESKYFRMKYEDNVAQLSISETFAEDEGEYVCLATNSAGTAKSVADLRVKACDEDELDNSTDNIVTTKPNEDVDSTFHSPISAKLNTPVANAVGHKVASFTMNATAKPFGDSSSKMPDVSPPEFLEELCDEPIIEGSAARLECRLIGDPEPVVYWYKDGKELKEGRKYSFEFDDDDIVALVIKETTMRDLGKYACKAVNSLGTVECSAQLIIEAPPKIEKYPRNLITCAGKDICITCKISGTPEPDLEWYRGKKEITEGGRIEMEDVDDDTMLYIRDAKQDDSGIYKLVLTSDLGTDSCTISVSVVDKPDPPSGKPVSSNVSRTSLTLSWSGSPYDGGSIITGYVVEMSKVNEDNWTKLTTAKSTSYVVRGLVPEKMYCFRIRSENAYGVSDPGMTSDPVRTTETKVQKESKADSGDEGECPFEARHVVIKSEDIKNSYDIQEQVGKGRFGIVHKCMEKATGKMWAAKFIKTKASEKESVKAEIEIMNQLQHPKLIQCVDAFETTREIIMVLEFVRGGELFERVIDDDFVLTEKDVIMFMRQICSGVKHMHSQNILHLDLKPENILCTDTTGNSIKLIDFGLARKFDPKQSVKVMFGTPEFVAPEVVNYEKIGYKTDMWSVGVICYILLSGLSPFMGDNDAETLSAVTMAEWDFEDESFDEISDEAKDFIEKLLLKSKDTRMSASDGLEHMWLTKDTKTMKTTKISTDKLKKFVARRRWQKTANAVRAISRMASLSMFSVRNRSLSQDDGTSGGLTPFSSILKAKREEAKNVNNITKTKEPEVDINLNETGTTKLSNRRNRKFTEEKRSSIDSDESPIKKRSSSDGSVKKLSTDSFSRFGSKSSLPSPNIEMKTESSSRASGEQKIWPPSGQRATRDAVINKEAKPKFLKKIRSTTVLEGQKAQFNCIVIGDPLPDVTWYQDGLELPENGRFTVEKASDGTCSLRITNVVEDDDAEYTAKAINVNGDVTCTAELVVDIK